VVNWIGVGSRKGLTVGRGPLVTFDHFVRFEEKGQDFRVIAPTLAERMYSTHAPRFLFNDDFNEAEQAEIDPLRPGFAADPANANDCIEVPASDAPHAVIYPKTPFSVWVAFVGSLVNERPHDPPPLASRHIDLIFPTLPRRGSDGNKVGLVSDFQTSPRQSN
jgi:hypothetical protein